MRAHGDQTGLFTIGGGPPKAPALDEETAPEETMPSDPQLDGVSLRVPCLPVDNWLTVRHNAAGAQDRAARRARLDGDNLRLQDWLENRPATTRPDRSASQRMQALRDRLRLRHL